MILPKRKNYSKDASDLKSKSPIDFDEGEIWSTAQTNQAIFKKIEAILSETKGWGNQMKILGNPEKNCLEVHWDKNDNIVSASLRIDFRSDYSKLMEEIVNLLIENQLGLFDEASSEVTLDLEEINNIIQNSPNVKTYKKLTKD
jgi:hypothetical protein